MNAALTTKKANNYWNGAKMTNQKTKVDQSIRS